MKRAAIAVGSNSTRLLCAELTAEGLKNRMTAREETRLFSGLDAGGSIRPERLEATAQAVARLWAAAVSWGAEQTALFATSASRDAANSGALARRIRQLCGLDMQIISGTEEAALAFGAVSAGKRRLVMDIGGGSTEWTLGENGRIEWSVSMQLGASRLLAFRPVACPEDARAVLASARSVMTPYAERLRGLPPAPEMVGLGGSCTTLAAMEMGREAHGDQVEGAVVTRAAAAAWLERLSGMTLEERRRVPGLPPGRAEHMPHGLCILLTALELCGHERLTVSARTNLDGYLLRETAQMKGEPR